MKLKIEVNLDHPWFNEPDELAAALGRVARSIGGAPRIPEDGEIHNINGDPVVQWEVTA